MKPIAQAVEEHPFALGMEQEHALLLALSARRLSFAPGDIIFQQGQPAGDFYLIESGRVVLEGRTKTGFSELQSLGAGEPLGWSWLFPPFVWHFQARVIAPASVLVLSGGQLMAQAGKNPEFGFELMKRVAKVVINRLQNARAKGLT